MKSECWIPLTQGKWTVVDLVDVDKVLGFSWYVMKRPGGVSYAARMSTPTLGKRRTISLHQELMGEPPEGSMIDHKDGDGLNNRRSSNLRFATAQQNKQNSRKHKNSISSFKGVSINRGRWKAAINIDGIDHHIGQFSDEVNAAKAYDKMAKEHFGAFARLNFPGVEPHNDNNITGASC